MINWITTAYGAISSNGTRFRIIKDPDTDKWCLSHTGHVGLQRFDNMWAAAAAADEVAGEKLDLMGVTWQQSYARAEVHLHEDDRYTWHARYIAGPGHVLMADGSAFNYAQAKRLAQHVAEEYWLAAQQQEMERPR